MAYGQMRMLLVDRAVAAVATAARVARLAVRLATRTSMGPIDLYAALATAKFMAAHELIEQAADAAEQTGDPEAEITDIRTPIWLGAMTIHEESQ
ncbi:hypothetical protein ACFY8C_38400 [Streptomyces flavochromogenes]|uniref:Acyl-CoA dehydrogenase n=1 Tax=Streptomyces flavochromogenes TaxID=68199 RepID=A0ABW6Y3N2_9ACTN